MQTLKKIISRYMRSVTFFLVIVLLALILYIQIIHEQKQALETATETFSRIGQLLEKNQEELAETKKAYRQTCLHNAEAISYIIEDNPSVLNSVEELKKIAALMEVDEIHIFDTTGRIYAGTHPEYFDFTFDSGEQMMFFKPMLTDRSLRLVQDITPNTAEEKLMQYSALWSRDENFIVQVGMEPVNVLKATEKNELSYIFSLLRVNLNANYYAVNRETGEIVGATDLPSVGRNLAEIGLDLDTIAAHKNGFPATVNGERSYCVFRETGENYIGRILSCRDLYQRIPATMAALAVCLITIAMILSCVVTRYMNRYVVEGIHSINEKLHSIAQGNLDEVVAIHSSVEFAELSSYINRMKKSILDNNRKMSYVLGKTNMFIGVYEYNRHMKRVRITEHVPKVLALEPGEAERLSADYEVFREFISDLRKNPVDDETCVFSCRNRYVKLEEISDGEDIFGVVIDVTEEIEKRKKIEAERDFDLLTGLYNRRGMERKLSALFGEPETLGHSMIVMADADNLKVINDTYGHDAGDAYLREIAGLFRDFGPGNCIAARLGGDEFLLFLYQYDSEQELSDAAALLADIQNHSVASLNDGVQVPLRFSFGYSLTGQSTDYEKLMKEADEKMYEDKRERKELSV
ncbi:MAG: GGDEF domain-containing protein [Lachnospiraceae bacterium]|nr:GGDEF domain-containing protein [Lachnospiraceae bacterium]